MKLSGGLCNKLFCLSSACDIALNKKMKVLEPYFGWKKKIKFSDIYDLGFFNYRMAQLHGEGTFMVPLGEKSGCKVKKNTENLWQHSQKKIRKQRERNEIDAKCMVISILRSLKLNEINTRVLCRSLKKINNKIALHMRIEDDWSSYYRKKNKNRRDNGTYLTNCDSLIDMYSTRFRDDVFFTTGQNQNNIKKRFSDKNINSEFTYDRHVEYEINAAINFELCCQTKMFIGSSRSTFSNLISLKRSLINVNNSRIYNLNNDIVVRVDHGLHCDPAKSVTSTVAVRGRGQKDDRSNSRGGRLLLPDR